MKAKAATSAELSEIFDAMWSQIRSANLTSGQPRGSASTESVSLARSALNLARSNADPLFQAEAHRMMAYTLNANEQYEESLPHYRRALEILDAAGREEIAARTRLGFVAALQTIGRHDEAIEVAECARRSFVARDDMPGLARLYVNLGNVYQRLGGSARALEYHQKAQAIFRRQNDKGALAQCFVNSAICLSWLDRFEESERSYRQAERLSKELRMSDLRAQAQYNRAYLLFQRGRYSDALDSFSTLRRRFEEQQSLRHCGLCDLDMAEIYLHLNLPSDAAPLARRAAQIFRRLGIRYQRARAMAFVGVASAQMQDLEDALSILEQSHAMFRDEQNDYWSALLDLYRAELLFAMKDFSRAQSLANAAHEKFSQLESASRRVLALILLARIALCVRRRDDARLHAESALQLAREYKIQPLMFPSLVINAELFEHAGEHIKAGDFYEQAASALDMGLTALRHDDLKVAFFKGKPAVYEALARIALSSGGREQSVERAYNWCERAKSRSLIDLLSQHVRAIRAQADDPLLGKAQKLREELNNYYLRTWPAEGLPSESDRDSIQLKEHELARLLREMSDRNAEYVSLQKVSTASLEQVQQSLSAEMTMVEYFTIGGEVIAFVIDRSRAHVVRHLCSHEDVQQLQEQLQFQLERMLLDPGHVREHGSVLIVSAKKHLTELYGLLVAPVQKMIQTTRLVIVPHGMLHYLPFHAFYDGTQFLMDAFEVSYAPSASVFRYCVHKPDVVDSSPLIIGVPDSRAPQIRDETATLCELLPHARILEGRRATRSAFKGEAGRADFVHIATHAVFREDNPMFSAFKLSGGWITALDLYGLRCEANLVTLSGCSSGMHAIEGADDLLGLVRGFLYAGARSLLLTLWPVSDESTSQLMKAFYKCWISGMSRTAAIQQACREVRSNFPHPFFWAPFVLIGKP
jgi:CHAT domain-containing protein/tetratricopeptide (TPR) repeat protein